MSKILVTGATGQLGAAVVKELLGKTDAGNVSVLVRDLAKAESLTTAGVNVILGNYNDESSLIAAFQGVDKLYFVSSSEIEHRYAQHEIVVKAAVEAGIGHILYTSAQRKSEDGTSPIAMVADAHWKTDNLIKESGLTYTILKHGLYSDILPMFIGGEVLQNNMIFLPAGEGKSAYASRNDMGTAGAILLTTEGHENKVYELGGVEAYSFQDIAGMLSELSGKAIQYISPAAEAYADQLRSLGVGEQMIQGASTFCVAIAQGEFDFPSNDLKKILGREPQSVKDFLKAAYQL